MNKKDFDELERAIAEISEIAVKFGLDFYPMRFEICPADIIYTFGAYGMPTRFSHWSFGKAFHRMKTHYDLGLSKIYELVINSNPCYAFLMEGNSLIQNKLIVAHVLAHSDFFKNNARFSRTNRNMVESMSAAAERIRRYEIEYGKDVVEQFLDAVLAIQEHIDPSLISPYKERYEASRKTDHAPKKTSPKTGYEDLWDLDGAAGETKEEEKKFPPEPEKDLMWFIEEYSPVLEDWQRDIMTMLRDEMLYFWPQLETKIMNEGWATYWHQKILRELDLTEDETVEYAKLNASVVQPSQSSINPYYLGLKIFEDIEKRWNEKDPKPEMSNHSMTPGRAKIFEVRELESDVSFLRNYLTKSLIEELDLFVFQKEKNEWKITDKSWENVRDQLVYSRINGGFPYLVVKDGNYRQSGELYIQHCFEGMELDLKYLEKTMPYVYRLWGKPVHLETVVENHSVLFTCGGEKIERKFL